MKYSVILCDAPWSYNRDTGRGAAKNHYGIMTTKQIADMRDRVQALAADDCALFMWATFPTIHTHALPVMDAWGFAYKTAGFVWVKVSKRTGQPVIGPGQYTRSNVEPCLIGIRGHPVRKSMAVRQVILAPRAGHSVKPAAQYGRIEALYDGPYIELFARRAVDGWDVDGLEMNGMDYVETETEVICENEFGIS